MTRLFLSSALVLAAALAPAAQPVPTLAPADPSGVAPDSLTLAAALTLALDASPDLAALAFETRARQSLVDQAGRRLNPSLRLDTENLLAPSGSGPGGLDGTANPAQTTLEVVVPFEPGRRAARVRLAEAERDLLPAAERRLRLDVVARVTGRFAVALAAQERARLAAEVAGLAGEGSATARQQVSIGDRSPIEQTRAEVAFAVARAEAARAEREADAATRALAALWGAATDPPEALEGTLVPVPLPPFAALVERLGGAPELARFAAEAARRDALVGVERAATRLTPTVTAGIRRYHAPGEDGGGFGLVAGVGLPLPVFNRNTDAARAAAERRAAIDPERAAVRDSLVAALALAYGRLAAAHDEAAILAGTAVPGALDAAARVNEGYQLGRFGILDVLDAQRAAAQARGLLLDALAEAAAAAADVERLTGEPLPPAAPEVPRLPTPTVSTTDR
jgi:cobalt-zinc-cadmium efflux system outer membrane protein